MTISQCSEGAVEDFAGAVDVALHDVAAEAVADGGGPLEVDAGADGEGAEAGALEGLRHDIGGELVAFVVDDGEAYAVDGDGVAVFRALGDHGAAQAEATGVVEGLDGGDLAQLFDDSGEHFPGPPASSGTDSGAVDDDRSRARTPGATPDRARPEGEPVRRRAWMPARRALPPIRTLTVGPGISPGQPAAGSDRVADCNRRFGLSPTPECAATGTAPVCHGPDSATRVRCVE